MRAKLVKESIGDIYKPALQGLPRKGSIETLEDLYADIMDPSGYYYRVFNETRNSLKTDIAGEVQNKNKVFELSDFNINTIEGETVIEGDVLNYESGQTIGIVIYKSDEDGLFDLTYELDGEVLDEDSLTDEELVMFIVQELGYIEQ